MRCALSRFAAAFGFVLLLACALAGAQDLAPVPRLAARVNDTSGTLAADQRSRLEEKLAAFEREKGVQIAVLVVATVKPETVEQYALRVVEGWRLGRRGVDDGVLLLIAREDRKLRIEVGYGLEGALNDATAKRIISETISPRFKQGDFYGGIDAGLDAMIRIIAGEALPAPAPAAAEPSLSASDDDRMAIVLFAGVVLVFVVGRFLRAIFGRLFAAGIVGTVAGVIAALLISSLIVGVMAGVVAFVAALIAGQARGGRRGGGWPSGGITWGGGGSSGGFSDSFSGGGGSFGGGGASGDW
ncbi:MAG: TPM domain-containing protein [Candidatus Accumulibacter sp.]|uniref:TPM domain-containing protein n=1 Tax=Accumulibacter sp. TaxID=2053492 RepID=UPI0028782FFE|nr:TPM domain-containing protein [Accumulibacter sp.]MDS4013833.1 TPM domain-containing protein [Accumulibacter sp.]